MSGLCHCMAKAGLSIRAPVGGPSACGNACALTRSLDVSHTVVSMHPVDAWQRPRVQRYKVFAQFEPIVLLVIIVLLAEDKPPG